MNDSPDTILEEICDLLRKTGLLPDDEAERWEQLFSIQLLHGDGSSRRFYRVLNRLQPYCVAVYPYGLDPKGLAEYSSAYAIGKHLESAGLPVPHIIAADDRLGLLLFEDLGDIRLHDFLERDRQKGLALYPEILRLLARLQVEGSRGFQAHWCHDTAQYDQEVMLEKESGYFYRTFWQSTLEGEEIPGLSEEFAQLAEQCARYFQPCFLHRDFQSRNLMVDDGVIRVIDFQAGRFGPPAYDCASLLIDPYAALTLEEQNIMLDLYFSELRTYREIDIEQARVSYPYLALQRNLQILGAFAFLSGSRQKVFFKGYIKPALVSLNKRLSEPTFQDYRILKDTALLALKRYEARIGE